MRGARGVRLPVAASFRCQDLFDNRHPNYAGEIPWRLRPNILELVKNSDCVIALDWLDVGGTLGQVTTDIFSEGIQIPIVKVAA